MRKPSDRLDPYGILSPLVAEGMVEVYRARDTPPGREVARHKKTALGLLETPFVDVRTPLLARRFTDGPASLGSLLPGLGPVRRFPCLIEIRMTVA